MDHEVKYKLCAKCGVSKPLYDFNINKVAWDRLTSRCRECIREFRKPTEVERLRKKVDTSKGHFGKFLS